MATRSIPFTGLACSAGDGFGLGRALRRVPGVIEAYVNPVTDTIYLTVDPDHFSDAEASRVITAYGAREVRHARSGPSDEPAR